MYSSYLLLFSVRFQAYNNWLLKAFEFEKATSLWEFMFTGITLSYHVTSVHPAAMGTWWDEKIKL